MSRHLIKPMNSKAYALLEILFAAVFAALLMGMVVYFYTLSKRTYTTGVSRQWLQDSANIVLAKIIHGKFHLSEAQTYHVPSLSELHFTALGELTERSYRLNGSATSVIYNSGSGEEVIYTAPPGATITLRFSQPYSGMTIGIDVAIIQNISGMTVSGSASTYVPIRNRQRI